MNLMVSLKGYYQTPPCHSSAVSAPPHGLSSDSFSCWLHQLFLFILLIMLCLCPHKSFPATLVILNLPRRLWGTPGFKSLLMVSCWVWEVQLRHYVDKHMEQKNMAC
uniref:Transmembrane protein n=1 Tax=Medicago truncatula TaxID=3880 RepID=I3S597_MEDTR|nr:unknown [Medicago truncatula]